jgi:quercetin dioxygenase-like cupin family protein
VNRNRFQVRLIMIPPGGERPYRAAEWHDALIQVERGSVELYSTGGRRVRLSKGAILSLDRLALRTIRNHRRTTAVLSAFTVKRTDPARCPVPSSQESVRADVWRMR